MRLLACLSGLAAILLLPFLAFGEHLEVLLSGPRLAALLASAEGWGWVIGLGLLGADLLLPIPATGGMAALGVAYGPLLGGGLSALGSFLSGCLGYAACRLLSEARVERLVGAGDLARARQLAANLGGWLVAGSRALPLLPELVACAAGLVRMAPGRFFPALACGAIPTGFAFAGLGAIGSDRPVLTVVLATVLPLALWPLVRLGARHVALQE